MTTAPQINLRDGSGSATEVVFTTNQAFITLEGTVDTNAVDIQVSIDGAAFVSDSTLVELDGVNFTVPNPSSYPDGLPLQLGSNSVRIRSIDIVGSVSPIATASITRVAAIEGGGAIPTGIKTRRRRSDVDILIAKLNQQFSAGRGEFSELTQAEINNYEFQGFNVYASTSPGGTTGYFKINENIVTEESGAVFDEAQNGLSSEETEFEPIDGATKLRLRLTQEDEFDNELDVALDSVSQILTVGTRIRLASTLDEVIRTEYAFFSHNRAGGVGIINSDQWADVEDSEPLYYVVTGMYYDANQRIEYETPYSQEVLSKPLIIDTAIRDLPGRTQLQVTLNFVDAIQRVNEEITLVPGSTSRDVSIDPFASEAERIWFILDFVHRSQSFLTLIQIDDANGDEVSDPVVSSAYKSALKAALGFSTDLAVQQLIDTQFDKLAGNFQKTRLPGRPASGQAVFYSTTRPTQDVTIAAGTAVSTDADAENNLPAVRFIVGGTYVLPAADAEAFYNFETQRYEIITDITAESAGADGNRSAESIKNLLSTVSGFSVTNTEATVFGTDRESNNDLAVRAELGFVSVDTGTEGGYASTAAEQIGLIKTKIVKSGDALMMRDYDDVRDKHIGGKVDIWVQGLQERTVTETFAFTFEIARDVQCQIIDVTNLIFRVLDSRVTPDTPIVEILDNLAQGLGVRNATQGLDYDLTGVTLIDYQTFQVDAGIQSFTTFIDDVIIADYRYRSVNQFTFSLQPVRRVTSVVGEASGALSSTEGYDLFKTEDPLLEGESTIASDYLVINQVGGVPSGDTIAVNDETHVIIGFFEERLSSIGINTATIRVFDEARVVEYAGPGSAAPDFEIIEGTAVSPARIIRSSSSTIVSGQTVSVDYEHDENFTVTYVINDLLQQLQRTINTARHTTADVLVKQAILNSVDLETTIQLDQGAKKDTVDPAVRSNVSRELNQKLIGQGTAQSDLINAIDSTEGVDFQVLPLAVMGYADGSRKMRASVLSTNDRLGSLDVGGNRVFILTNALQYPTIDGGGTSVEHKGVFQDDIGMTLAPSLATVGQYENGAYIIGATGAVISGYSDDATIISETGLTDPDDIEAERLRRTANHVVTSLSGADVPPDDPENHDYAASYVIQGDTGPHDLQASEVEFLDLGALVLTFREASS
jgi:hypothetical protein